MERLEKLRQEGRPVYDGYLLPIFPVLLPDPIKHMESIRNFDSKESDILLCSFPKSGSNWVYEIVKMLLRGTSEYDNKFKIAAMMEATKIDELERLQQTPRFMSTHLPFRHIPKKHVENGSKIIRILRNPKDVMVSAYNHLKNDPSGICTDTFPGLWCEFFQDQIENIHNFYEGFFKYQLDWEEAIRTNKVTNVCVAFYEDMKKNPMEEIKRLAKFLEVEATDKFVKEIADKCSFQKLSRSLDVKEGLQLKEDGTLYLFRKGTVGDWKNWFTVAQNEQYDDLYANEMKDSNLKFTYYL